MFFTKLKGLEGPYGIRNVQFYVHPVYYNDVPSVLYDATHSSYANTWSADGYFSDFKFIRSRYSFNIVITDKRGDVDYLMDAFYVDMY
ncbi:MAG: hypothetical protein RSC60_02720, partial [Christensenellaceae bacterium]